MTTIGRRQVFARYRWDHHRRRDQRVARRRLETRNSVRTSSEKREREEDGEKGESEQHAEKKKPESRVTRSPRPRIREAPRTWWGISENSGRSMFSEIVVGGSLVVGAALLVVVGASVVVVVVVVGASLVVDGGVPVSDSVDDGGTGRRRLTVRLLLGYLAGG